MSAWPYNTKVWRKLRIAKLSRDPLCYACLLRDRIVPANTVDHRVPISSGGPAFPNLDGLHSLCHACHSEKTHTHDRQGGNALGRRFKGCGVDGNPIDPNDGWWT
ncbi:MAG: HNH endonuclease [Pseudomonadota bacterium]